MAKSRSKNAQNKYQSYKAEQRWLKNRKVKLEKLLKANPNREDVKLALSNLKYRRKTPKSQVWSKTMIAAAKLIKEFEGKFSHKEFLKEKVVFTTPTKETQKVEKEHKDPKGWYSIGTRTQST